MTVDQSVLLTERRDDVILAILNRPHAMNALNSDLRSALVDFWVQVRDDDTIRVAIVTGAGRRAFSAGRDLKETAAAYLAGETGTAAEASGRMGYPTDLRIGKPVIAAVNGHCLAAGLKLAVGCDLRLASTTARFGNPQAKVGRGTDMPLRLIKAGIPAAAVADLVYTGEPVDARTALAWGLVSRVVDPDELRELAWSVAATVAANSPLVVGSVKRLLDDGVADLPAAQAYARWHAAEQLFGDTPDARQGAISFAEGRPPRYR